MKNIDTELEKCIHHLQDVNHLNDTWKIKMPDCKKCDGYGVDSTKYNWKCYQPKKLWIRKY